jgi:hypothetical protein
MGDFFMIVMQCFLSLSSLPVSKALNPMNHEKAKQTKIQHKAERRSGRYGPGKFYAVGLCHGEWQTGRQVAGGCPGGIRQL